MWIERVAEADILAAARAVDARIAAGERLPLAGVPFAVKDNIDVAGPADHCRLPRLRLPAGRDRAGGRCGCWRRARC